MTDPDPLQTLLARIQERVPETRACSGMSSAVDLLLTFRDKYLDFAATWFLECRRAHAGWDEAVSSRVSEVAELERQLLEATEEIFELKARAKKFQEAAEAVARERDAAEAERDTLRAEARKANGILNERIPDRDFPVRIRNVLAEAGIFTIGDLVKRESELPGYRNFGVVSREFIRRFIEERLRKSPEAEAHAGGGVFSVTGEGTPDSPPVGSGDGS